MFIFPIEFLRVVERSVVRVVLLFSSPVEAIDSCSSMRVRDTKQRQEKPGTVRNCPMPAVVLILAIQVYDKSIKK